MQYNLQIQLKSSEGGVLRTLGLIERRGFRIESMTLMEPGGDGRSLTVKVTSDRAIELLKRQLARLHDVLWVDVKKPAANWSSNRLGN